MGSLDCRDWKTYQMWRFAHVQPELGKASQCFLNFPPMQAGASFNLSAMKLNKEDGKREAPRSSE
jgi:hypothetical protein